MPQTLNRPTPALEIEAPTAESIDWSAFFPVASQRRAFDAPGRNPWVILDRAWARELGVVRSAGVYRIHRRELIARLAEAEAQTGLRWLFAVPEMTRNPAPHRAALRIA